MLLSCKIVLTIIMIIIMVERIIINKRKFNEDSLSLLKILHDIIVLFFALFISLYTGILDIGV